MKGRKSHPEVLWVVPKVLQTLGHGYAVLLPLPLTKHDLLEVPHPANQRHIGKLLLGHDL